MLSVPPVNPITNAFTTRLRYAAAERAPKKVDSNESVADGFNLTARSVKRYSCDGSRGLPGKRLANHSQEKSERKTFHGSLQKSSAETVGMWGIRDDLGAEGGLVTTANVVLSSRGVKPLIS